MRKFLSLLAFVGLFSNASIAQTDISIGTGTAGNTGTTYPCPMQDWYEGSRAQYLYRASELAGAGMGPGNINSIKYNVTGLNTFSGDIQEFTVKIGGTTVTALSATTWEPSTVTKFGPVDYVPSVGVNTLTFSTPYFWNGTDNIIVEICNGLPANTTDGLIHYTNNVTIPWTTGLGFNASHTYRADNDGNLCNTTTTTNTGNLNDRPNITFNWSPASTCNSMPNAGTANANPTVVCLGQPIALSSTGVTVASGLAYQWQVSTNGGTSYANIAGATSLSASTLQTITSLYRFRVVCTLSNDTAYTAGVLVTSPPVPGGLYTINKNQPTNWPGGTNFASFNDAYNAIKCGISSAVVFDVVASSGPYTEQLIMTAVPNASAINTVTFKGNLNTLSFSSTNSNERAVIKLKGTRYIIFDSLVINANTGTFGYGVQMMTNADSNTIKNCIINTSTTATNTNFVGIVINGTDAGPIATGTVLCDFNTFDNNTITGGYYGMTLTASFAGGANGNNRITNNKFLDFYIFGIYVVGSYGTVIELNTLSRPTRSIVGDFNGIYFGTEKSVNAFVSKNRIKNPFGAALASTSNFYGIYFNNADGSAGGGDNIVSNNLIYKVNGNGPQYGIANNGSDYAQYFHNTISLDSVASTSTSLTRGFFHTTTASGLFFYNNLISITRGGNGAKHAIYLNTGLLGGCDYNDYYVNAGGTQNFIGFFTGNRSTLADWRTATTAGQHDIASFDANPAFFDVLVENYAPGNAGIDNAGIFTGLITDDILGVTRNQGIGVPTGPDIGAYEFVPPPCSTPPVKGPTTLSSINICQNQPVRLSLLIGPYGSAQTFQWQTATSLAGPFTNLGNPMLTTDTTILSSTTLYYRTAVKCGSTIIYTDTVLMTVNPALPAGAYTINDGQPTTYVPGIAGGNFNNFNAAKNAMNCGILGAVVFNVNNTSGPYNEQLILDSIKGTSPTNTITFNGNGRTITFNATNSAERAVIKLRGADYITFDSLTIDASGGSFGYGVQLINNADTNTIRRCNIISSTTTTSTGFAGIVVNATETGPVSTGNTWCDGNTFDRNTITGGFYGITLYGNTVPANFIFGNRITNNNIREYFSAGIQMAGTNNTLVEANTFSRPTRTSSAAVVYGVYLTTAINNAAKISKNRMTNMFGGELTNTSTFYGVYHNNIDATVVNEISNNAIYKINGNGPIYAFYNVGSDNVSYFHNTIVLDDTASTSFGAAVGFYQTTLATGLQFVDNLISIRRGGLGTKTALYFNSSTSDITSNYNNIFINASGNNNFVGFFNGSRITLADWRTVTSKDANSLALDPLYKDPANGDYSPQTTPLNDKGTPIAGITTDIYNRVRNLVTPDIGAFEFVPALCQLPPVAGTASVNPTIICLENKITLTLTGHSPVGSITFQWQASSDGVTWKNISGIQYGPTFDTLASVDTFYRAAVTCQGTTVYSTIAQTSLANSLLAGNYTIDPAGTGAANFPTGRNFISFQHAVSTMQCGIADKVVFNVVPGTYNEQIRIPYVAGTSSTKTVTFQSGNGLASAVNLTYDATGAGSNYTLKLDSASNFIFKNLTLTATNASFGRVVEFANTASFDSLLNCKIVAPATTNNTLNMAAVYSAGLKGSNNVIKGNNIVNGSYGIYYAGTGVNANLTADHVIDSNTVSDFSNYGIYASFQKRARLTRNTIQVTNPLFATIYGLYANDCDSSYEVVGNKITANNTIATVYGIYINNSDTSLTARGKIANNKVSASGTNTGSMYGLYIANSPGHRAVNNVVSLNNTGSVSYGLYTNSTEGEYYNNTIQTSGTSVASGIAGYFLNNATSNISVRNNIFSNTGGGRALFVSNTTQASAIDYNMLYTSGATLVQRATPAGNFANLDTWSTASFYDVNSIVYQPAFVNTADLMPNLANPDVWAMHGRGVQIPTNNYDYFNNNRPTTLTTGVPDMGAYEFLPTSLPTALTATPVNPVANQPQTFMYGTDTVMRVTWGATVPPTVTARRYSGVVPSNLGARPDSMYFYTKLESPAGSNFPYTMEQFYIDPWQGSIPDQNQIGLGRTNSSNQWLVGFNSRVDVRRKLIRETNLTFFDKFTGFINPYAPLVLPDKDSSNRGRRFWVGYQRSWDFAYAGCPNCPGSNSQEMVLYLSTTNEPANVQVRVNGTNWVRNYSIPANTTRASDLLPKTGADDARLLQEGLYNRGISITSDVPITAYAHEYANTNSGATMLFPIGVWGYEYYSLNNRQNYTATGAYTVFFVVADNDNTVVEITPSRPTLGGRAADVPFTVTLNKGDVYQVLGAMIGGSQGEDLTGSIVKSIPNPQGKCYPIGFFSGSTRTGLGCGTSNGSSGDLLLQQVFPYSAWGRSYLTAPTSNSASISSLHTNIFRVLVKDPATVVKRNNVTLTGLIVGRYYQYESNTADIIESDKPVMVSQYMSSSGNCPNTGGLGDPSSFILSPKEQAIKGYTGFYRNSTFSITVNYLTVILPTNGMNSLKVDGIPWATIPAADKFSYVHPNLLGYSVAIKRWPAGAGQSSMECDSAFTGLVYGLGSVESYGYNVGTQVKTLNALGSVDNTLSTLGNSTEFTCAGSPFTITALIPVVPTRLTWKFGSVPGLNPGRDTTIVGPIPLDSAIINGTKYYLFSVNQSFVFANPGVYGVPIVYAHPDIESCDKTKEDIIYIQVLASPKTNFAVNFSGCEGDIAQISGENMTENGIIVNNWAWTFHNSTTATGQNTSFTYNTPGTYNIKLRTITPDGCIGDSTKSVIVNPRPVVNVVADSLVVCLGSDTTIRVLNPITGAFYNWYTTLTGGTPVFTGPNYTITNVTAPAIYYIEGVSAFGCNSVTRKKVAVSVYQPLVQTTASFTSSTATSVSFSWSAVPNAASYQVSVSGGPFITPSSGTTGLTHIVTGVGTLQSICIVVKAIGTVSCQNSTSQSVCGCANSAAQVVTDSLAVCTGTSAIFNIQSPVTGLTYSWFSTQTGGTALATGPSFTATNVTGTTVYWVEQSNGTCIGSPRTRVVVSVFTPLTTTTVTSPAASSTATTVTFNWTAVPNAVGYQVSIGGGAFVTPSSGATGLTHVVTGLGTLQQVCIVVRAIGANSCQNSTSASVCGCTNSAAVVTPTTISICNGTTTTFAVQSPVTGITYRWYTSATGGTPIFTGASFTTPAISATTTYYVEQANTTTGCTSSTRTSVVVTVLPPLAQAAVRVDSVGANFVTFGWNAVPGAASYQVSLDNGVTWITPSSGATGLSHTAAPLTPLQEVTLIVRAIGNIPCQNSISNPVTGRARPDQIFIPNTFTPNGDGINDVLLVYGYTIRSMQFMVFNQWGNKVFESNNQTNGWDGRYKGKMQPSGVYMYVSKMTLIDGSVVSRKGSINLVR